MKVYWVQVVDLHTDLSEIWEEYHKQCKHRIKENIMIVSQISSFRIVVNSQCKAMLFFCNVNWVCFIFSLHRSIRREELIDFFRRAEKNVRDKDFPEFFSMHAGVFFEKLAFSNSTPPLSIVLANEYMICYMNWKLSENRKTRKGGTFFANLITNHSIETSQEKKVSFIVNCNDWKPFIFLVFLEFDWLKCITSSLSVEEKW